MKICPYCQFERIGKYESPDWECPKCQRVYSKYKADEYNIEKAVGLNKKNLVPTHIKIISWALSTFFLYTAISSTINGYTRGFGRGAPIITFVDNPIEFILVVTSEFIIGFFILLALLKKT